MSRFARMYLSSHSKQACHNHGQNATLTDGQAERHARDSVGTPTLNNKELGWGPRASKMSGGKIAAMVSG